MSASVSAGIVLCQVLVLLLMLVLMLVILLVPVLLLVLLLVIVLVLFCASCSGKDSRNGCRQWSAPARSNCNCNALLLRKMQKCTSTCTVTNSGIFWEAPLKGSHLNLNRVYIHAVSQREFGGCLYQFLEQKKKEMELPLR